MADPIIDATNPTGTGSGSGGGGGGGWGGTTTPATPADTNAPITPPASNPPTPTVPMNTANTPDTSAIQGENSATKDYIASQQKIAADAAAKAAATPAAPATAPTMEGYLASQGKQDIPGYQASTEESATEKYTGMTGDQVIAQQKAYTAQIDSLQKSIDNATTAKDAAIAAMTGRGEVPMDMLNNATAQINRNYNVAVATPLAEMNRVQAQQAALTGDLAKADAYTKSAVDAYTSVATTDFNAFTKWNDDNAALIASLSKDQQTALTNAYNAAQDDLKTQKQDLTDKMTMGLKYGLTWTSDQYAKASLADVASAVAPMAAKQNAMDLASKQADINAKNAAAAKDYQAQQTNNDTNTTQANLQYLAGKDGYVSPKDWNSELAKWIAAGYKETDFVSKFKQYTNPNTNYGRTVTAPKVAAAPGFSSNPLGYVMQPFVAGYNWISSLFSKK